MINSFLKTYASIFVSFVLLILSFNLKAEDYSCPSIDSIKSRTISKDFDWTVSENTSLEQVLNVTELIDVSIENHGEFIGCIYKSDNHKVRLDAKPITVDCLVVSNSKNWLLNQKGQSVCNEPNKMDCKFEISCQMIMGDS